MPPNHSTHAPDLPPPKGVMETLQANIETQEQCLATASTAYLDAITSAVQQRQDAGRPVTLALQTRQYRLSRVLEVLEEVISLETQLLAWYSNQEVDSPEDVDEDGLHGQIKAVVHTICTVTSVLEQDWCGGGGEQAAGGKTSVTSPGLERMIARLHDGVETLLSTFKKLIAYLKYHQLVPELPPPQHSGIQFYGNGMVRAEQQVLTALLETTRHAEEGDEEEQQYSMLDTPKIDFLLMSLPAKYIFVD